MQISWIPSILRGHDAPPGVPIAEIARTREFVSRSSLKTRWAIPPLLLFHSGYETPCCSRPVAGQVLRVTSMTPIQGLQGNRRGTDRLGRLAKQNTRLWITFVFCSPTLFPCFRVLQPARVSWWFASAAAAMCPRVRINFPLNRSSSLAVFVVNSDAICRPKCS